MEEEKLQCPGCGKHFSSEELLQEHAQLEHSKQVEPVRQEEKLQNLLDRAKKFWNRSFAVGLLLGILVSSTAFSGYMYWNSLDHSVRVPVTVVTCDSCEYGKFRNATDLMFNARYREVDYQSDQGQKLVKKYELNYVPGFIFDKKIEKAENFTRIEPVLVKFEDAYVIPDLDPETAQRLSEGKSLE